VTLQTAVGNVKISKSKFYSYFTTSGGLSFNNYTPYTLSNPGIFHVQPY